MAKSMDDKDKRIVAALAIDSRQSIRELAKKTAIRPSTVHQRIARLKKEGVIERFTVKLNNKKAGEDFIVFMLVTTREDLEPGFFHNNHLREAYGITGEDDLLLKLKFADIDEFNDYIISLRKNKKIVKTHTMISTINLKEEF